ncbi:MAG: hypothetical protein ACYDCK_01115 [Thermoplasmatota archaeon]
MNSTAPPHRNATNTTNTSNTTNASKPTDGSQFPGGKRDANGTIANASPAYSPAPSLLPPLAPPPSLSAIHPPAATPKALGASAVGFALVGLLIAVAIAVRARDAWRYAVRVPFSWWFGLVGAEEDVDILARSHVERLVRANPGAHFGALEKEAGLGPGPLVYHLRTLQRQRRVTSKKEGAKRKFYPLAALLPIP